MENNDKKLGCNDKAALNFLQRLKKKMLVKNNQNTDEQHFFNQSPSSVIFLYQKSTDNTISCFLFLQQSTFFLMSAITHNTHVLV